MLGYDCQNVIATQTGTMYPDQYWIICGHLDSTSPYPQTDAPGANDNGSGSSAVMEAARIMSQYDFEYTVRYCLWGGEEQGLYGSTHYADSVAAAGDDILGVVNLDMLLWYTGPFDSAEVHCNTASENLRIAFDSISSTYVPDLETTFPSSPLYFSDHASFWNAGYAALCNIEQAWFMDLYYHSTDDEIGNYLEFFPFGTNIAKASIATVAYLAVPTGTGIEEQNHQGLSGQLALQPVQNPATGSFVLSVALPSGGPVTLQVFDTAGRMVRSLVKDLQPGTSEIHLAAEDLSPGMYLVKAISASESVSTRIMLIR